MGNTIHEDSFQQIPTPNIAAILGLPPQVQPDEALGYIETYWTVPGLVESRDAQARLARTLARDFYTGERVRETWRPDSGGTFIRDMEEDFGKVHNPAPELRLVTAGIRGERMVADSFLLFESGDKHRYYFKDYREADTDAILRDEDKVPSGTFRSYIAREDYPAISEALGVRQDDIPMLIYEVDPALAPYYRHEELPFTSILVRVPAKGGAEQRYNYVQGVWEKTGRYTQDLRGRVARVVGAIASIRVPDVDPNHASSRAL